MLKKCLAEFLGTAVLVTFGCGVAATHAQGDMGTGYVGIALAFGLVIVALAYSIGNVSGCHVNPAVSLAMLINKKLTGKEFVLYVISQVLGAVFGGFVLCFMFGFSNNYGFGTNGYGELSAMNISAGAAFCTEVVLTFVFVFAICGVTSKPEFGNVAGLVIGFSLTLVHLLGLPLTGTSVNPARSFGAAAVAALAGADNGAAALSQVWVFILAPMIGGAFAAFCYNMLYTAPKAAAPAASASPAKKSGTQKKKK